MARWTVHGSVAASAEDFNLSDAGDTRWPTGDQFLFVAGISAVAVVVAEGPKRSRPKRADRAPIRAYAGPRADEFGACFLRHVSQSHVIKRDRFFYRPK